MSTDHFEDIDHDQPDGIAAAFRETAFSFEAPASAVLHAGALAHARRHRRRSAAAGTLAAVAAVGVAGAVVTMVPSRTGASTPSSVGPGAAGVRSSSSTPSPNPSPSTDHSTSPAAVAPTHVTAAQGKALASSVLDIAVGALPPGSHPIKTGFGAGGTRIPDGKNLPVNGAPANVLGTVDGTWSLGTQDGPGAAVVVSIRTDTPTCQKMRLSPNDVCTVAPFAKGGEFITYKSRKDPVTETGPYFLSYVWVRPDGAVIEVDMVEPSPSQFTLTSDQASTLLEAPGWDQAVTQLKALVANAVTVP